MKVLIFGVGIVVVVLAVLAVAVVLIEADDGRPYNPCCYDPTDPEADEGEPYDLLGLEYAVHEPQPRTWRRLWFRPSCQEQHPSWVHDCGDYSPLD